MANAAALVIGDEILNGRIADENGPRLVRRLRELGIDLCRLVYLPDDVEAIAEEIARTRPRVDHLFTSGGVGPTHDDRTFEGIARGLGVPLEFRRELAEVLERRIGPLNESVTRMVRIPRGAEFWWDGEIAYPVIVWGNIRILPGVPSIFRRKLDAVSHRLAGRPALTEQRMVAARETRIAHLLQAVDEDHPAVTVGSYPRTGGSDPRVLVTLESRDPQALAESLRHLSRILGPLFVEE